MSPLDSPTPDRPLVVGIGHEFRGDDAVGPAVAHRLVGRLDGAARVVALPPDGPRLLELWDGVGLAIVVDAVRSGAPVGTVHRIEVGAAPLPASFAGTSTHALALGPTIALGQALGRRPRRLVVYGIEGRDFGIGHPLSPPVEAAIEAVADRVVAEVADA